jgi:threonine dehydratase
MYKNVDEILTVTDDQLRADMRFCAERMKMVVEPTGCLALAGVRKMAAEGRLPVNSKIGIVISGGNIDLPTYCRLLQEEND